MEGIHVQECTSAILSALSEGGAGSVAALVSRLHSERPVGTSAPAAGDGGRAPSAKQPSDSDCDCGQAAAATAAPPAAPLRIRKPDPAVVSRLRGLDSLQKTEMLLDAALEGAERRLQTLVAAGADVEATEKGTKALHIAAQEGHVEAVRFLVERGAFVDAVDGCSETPLFAAASHGLTEVVRCLLEAQASVLATGSNKRTPLHQAATNGHAAVVRLLIEASADPNARDKNGRTPLNEAAYSGDAGTVAAMLEAGADKGAVSEDWGETPLDVAVDNDHRHLIEMLS